MFLGEAPLLVVSIQLDPIDPKTAATCCSLRQWVIERLSGELEAKSAFTCKDIGDTSPFLVLAGLTSTSSP